MKVYVLNADGTPLMPSERYGKVRRLLNEGKATVVKKNPIFVIQLKDTIENPMLEKASLGVDAGSKHIGLSVTTKDEVLFEGEVTLRNEVHTLMNARKTLRNGRRYRKVRYRKCRIDNRRKGLSEFRKTSNKQGTGQRLKSNRYNVYSKSEEQWLRGSKKNKRSAKQSNPDKTQGWLPPTNKSKVLGHVNIITMLPKYMPINNICIEVANFDTQKLKNPNIKGEEYQQGVQLGFYNVRDYVLWRDKYTCQLCKKRNKILEVHHIIYRHLGGTDRPENLITLCCDCHTTENHNKGKILYKWCQDAREGKKKLKTYKDPAFMGLVRNYVYYSVRNYYKDTHMNVSYTYGYITKTNRINHGLPKKHCIDARCISGNPQVKSDGMYYRMKKLRRHNRQLHKIQYQKGGFRPATFSPHLINGYRLNDRVSYQGRKGYISSRNQKGYFCIKTLDGEVIKSSAKVGSFKLITPQKNYLTEYSKL